MKTFTLNKLMASAAVCMVALSGAASADPHPDAELIIEGELNVKVRAEPAAHLDGAVPEIYSGWLFRTDETRSLQMDDFENPAMLGVEAGQDAWNTVEGAAGKSCADCHGDAAESMKGVRAVMPKVNDNGDLWSTEDYVNNCRTERMEADALKWNSGDLNNMVAYISVQSRGMPVAVQIDGEAEPFWERGKDMYYTRFGQLELSCASCHEENYGMNIRADHLSQGQINGFPTYRLKQGKLISTHNRFRGCIRDTRAESFAMGSQEFRELELYVASRGLGLDTEGVAVRN
ncbi:SoxAX cytochrome complex subunit A [Roseibaca ekhonensis]|jgi:sulfur-oxidizing protein SoxA|uniref:SoxAX cytochrome complex subunit A n=1 Tax=Roseinatronobacter ekhonensis TaxID=254356 RepID=A0A3B0M2B2_9RHOB|nr:sulfur oxidation c-type cytochrome SoxA [Roseibaca ekhonensis]SUZ30312.1 SoxAX cytochrome complex subunit A [Roseibaca ekhonensis]